jgi:hypothetical protein
MTLTATLARIDQLQGLLSPQPVVGTGGAAAPAAFAATLQAATPAAATPAAAASAASLLSPAAAAGGTNAGRTALAAAQAEVGQGEQPPGSNDSPRIAQYRNATAGSGVGPWCAYFVSWAARQAGAPLGDSGQGFGRVDDVWSWAERTGKAMPAGSGQPPQPGDLIVWDEHIGIVESVDADGSIHTVEGNSSDRVSRRSYGSDGGGAVGFVRLG